MPRPTADEPTPVELEILNVLWETGPAPLSQICEALREKRSVATTTVATILSVMLKKELVERSKLDRGSLWSAKATRKKTAKGMVGKLVEKLFGGSAKSLVAHLIDEGEITPAQRDELLDLLRKAKRGAK